MRILQGTSTAPARVVCALRTIICFAKPTSNGITHREINLVYGASFGETVWSIATD